MLAHSTLAPALMRLYRSNRTERLIEALSENIGGRVADPFKPECIVVQGRGMEKWLSMQLAERHGVWAHVEYPFPRSLIERVLLAGEYADSHSLVEFQPDRLQWLLAQRLLDFREDPRFAAPSSYLQGAQIDARALSLGRKVAMLLDDYALRRPDLCMAWEHDSSIEHWQAVLWREVIDVLGPHHIAHGVRRALDDWASGGAPARESLPARISLFGISTLPPLYLQMLVELSRALPIDLYLLSPTDHLWSDLRSESQILRATVDHDGSLAENAGASLNGQYLESGHPLLGSLGRTGREFSGLLNELLADPTGEALFITPETTSLLSTLQRNILELEGPSPREFVSDPPGPLSSLQVHACHSALREVEVLHDAILELLQKRDHLEPHDIVVMAPNIDHYAPLIEAVFRNASSGTSLSSSESAGPPTLSLPFRITDGLRRGMNSAAHAFVDLLSLLDSRLGANEVLSLLADANIRGRFDIEHDDLTTISSWIKRAGVFWGSDGEHRGSLGLPNEDERTWRFGVERLLLGYALADDFSDFSAGRLAGPGEEGSRAELLGQFIDYVVELSALAEQARTPKTMREWYTLLTSSLPRLVHETPDNVAEHQWMVQTFASLAESAEAASFTMPISISVVRRLVSDRLEREGRPNHFGQAGITFCELMPMRSVPFPVICLLGMNEGEFPRQEKAMGFDLRRDDPRPGDRSVREDDKYLFLECLLAAREVLWISHIGQSAVDGTKRPPSVLVSELLDLAARMRGADDPDSLVNRHKLHPFHPEYFETGGNRFSYRQDFARIASPSEGVGASSELILNAPIGEAATQPMVVELAELHRFFKAPVTYFLKNTLEITSPREAVGLPDREPFKLDGLSQWGVGDEVLRSLAESIPAHRILPALVAKGMLPPGPAGEVVFQKHLTAARPILARARSLAAGQGPRTLAIDLDLGRVRLVGEVDQLHGDQRIAWCFSKPSASRAMPLWIDHLCAQAAAPTRSLTSTLCANGNPIRITNTHPAKSLLCDLVDVFIIGQRYPLPLEPRRACAFAKVLHNDSDDTRGAWREARKVTENGYGERQSEEIVWRGQDPLHRTVAEEPSFESLATRVYHPLLKHSEGV